VILARVSSRRKNPSWGGNEKDKYKIKNVDYEAIQVLRQESTQEVNQKNECNFILISFIYM
jgi:hypothetical protein